MLPKSTMWTPMQQSGCVRWFSPTLSPRSLNGSKIAQLNDLTASGDALVQSTDTNRPLLVKNAVNGRAVMAYDGVSSFMNMNIPFTDSSCTIVIVYESQTTNVGGSLAGSSTVGGALYFQYVVGMQVHLVTTTTKFNTGTGIYKTFMAVFNNIHDLELYYDNALVASGDPVVMSSMLLDIVGQRYDGVKVQANIAEIVVIDHPLNTAERKEFHDGMFAYMGFSPLQLPNCVKFVSPISSPITIGTGISAINDLSHDQEDFTQGIATSQPALDPTGINLAPAIISDGVDDYLGVNAGPYTSDQFTVFYVAENISYQNDTTAVDLVDNAAPNDWDVNTSAIVGTTVSPTKLSVTRNVTLLSEVTNPAAGVPYTFGAVFDGVNCTAYLNGVASLSVASTGSFDIKFMLLFARWLSFTITQFQAIKMGDMIAYSDAKNAAQMMHLHNFEVPRYIKLFPLSLANCISYVSPINSEITIDTGIASIEDLSTAQVNYTQGTGTAQAALDLTGINGSPAIVPDGIDDFLIRTIAEYTGTQLTVFFVAEHQSYTIHHSAMSLSGAGSNDFANTNYALPGFSLSSTVFGCDRDGLKGEFLRPGTGVPYTYGIVFDGATATGYLNGVPVASVASTGNFGFFRMQLAARWVNSGQVNFFDVKLGDVIHYSDAKNAAEMLQLHNFEFNSNRYGV